MLSIDLYVSTLGLQLVVLFWETLGSVAYILVAGLKVMSISGMSTLLPGQQGYEKQQSPVTTAVCGNATCPVV